MKTQLKKNILAIAISASLIAVFSQATFAMPPMGGGGPQGQQGGPQQDQQGQQGEPDAAAILVRMDYDEDGVVTLDDFVNHSLERADKHFTRMDSDEDGVVSEDEFATKKPGREEDASIDHDALKLCIEEVTGVTLKDRPTPEEAFGATDADGDGFITADEFLDEKANHSAVRFSELDSDGDGVISEEEVTADLTERQAVRAAHESCLNEQLLLDESSNNI